ncbi:Fur family transcriptional regulator [Saccharicrinis fermentans]|uniref:Zinc uptake transcriptional repressor n=1 Tax=Saccharicrinis fermentans DSM 9555 = JCM 21142 TaxID=869213 RepID=W7Y5R9_9BACT|nr:transcriptional repressor [Saccharicrinis fermentans]GAF02938.1 zinc uptake transcriptional repressor [Saccharicrinis fermentans DSM 9555 = JCM 21142]
MDAENILKQKGLKVTQNRLELVTLLKEAIHPMNQKDIEATLSGQSDRVTIYRNLKSLVKNEVIHKIEVNGSITSYSINRNIFNTEYDTEHLHFHCNICHQITCMPQCKIKQYELPEGYIQQSSKLIINGICKLCSNKNK